MIFVREEGSLVQHDLVAAVASNFEYLTPSSLLQAYLSTVRFGKCSLMCHNLICAMQHNYINSLLKVHVTSSMEMGSIHRLRMRTWCGLHHTNCIVEDIWAIDVFDPVWGSLGEPLAKSQCRGHLAYQPPLILFRENWEHQVQPGSTNSTEVVNYLHCQLSGRQQVIHL